VFESFGYGLQCSHGVPCDSDHLRHRDRSLDSAGHTFSAHAPLPVADLHDAVVAANRGNRRKDTVFGDAVEERLGQVRIFAHIVAELQTVRSRCSTVPPSGVWGPLLRVGAVLGLGGGDGVALPPSWSLPKGARSPAPPIQRNAASWNDSPAPGRS
jgi:hypothetical protein